MSDLSKNFGGFCKSSADHHRELGKLHERIAASHAAIASHEDTTPAVSEQHSELEECHKSAASLHNDRAEHFEGLQDVAATALGEANEKTEKLQRAVDHWGNKVMETGARGALPDGIRAVPRDGSLSKFQPAINDAGTVDISGVDESLQDMIKAS